MAFDDSLFRLLIRFDLTKEQVRRVATPGKRREAGIDADEQAIIENPYLLVESDLGEDGSAPIDFEAIDLGMLPDKDKLPLLAEPLEEGLVVIRVGSLGLGRQRLRGCALAVALLRPAQPAWLRET